MPRAPRKHQGEPAVDGNRDIFVNCPFDAEYKPLFDAIVFTIVRFGYRVRCALEVDNAGDNRLEKICGIIAESGFGIHDISRTEVGTTGLPRFNMPLELGLFFGARRFGGRAHEDKVFVVFDRAKYRYHEFISDIGGQDIRSHDDDVATLIRELSAWLRLLPGDVMAGGKAVAEEYATFREELPKLCAALSIEVSELEFKDYFDIVSSYATERL